MLEQVRERSGTRRLLIVLVLAALALRLGIPLGLLDRSGVPEPAVTQGHPPQQSSDATVRQSIPASDCHCPLTGRNRTVRAQCNCFGSPTAFWSNPRLPLASSPLAVGLVIVLVADMAVLPATAPPAAVPGRGLAAPPPPSQAPPSSPSDRIMA